MNGDRIYLFDEPITEVIKRRESIRTYSRMAVPQDIKDKIKRYFNELEGPFSTPMRFMLLDRDDIKADEGIKLGTYGMIVGAKTFIASAAINDEHCMEQTGYVFEKLILYITSLGVGTCWIAGTFHRSSFAKAIKIGEGEILPVITPIGYAGRTRSVFDIAIKPLWKVKRRKEWSKLC